MRPDIQASINERVTEQSHRTLLNDFNDWLGMKIDFRLMEAPIIVSHELRAALETSAVQIIKECIRPEMQKYSDATLRDHYTVPNQNPKPLFSVADFAICKNEFDVYTPRLIELQGFPSLFGYQYALASRMCEAYRLNDMTMLLSNLSTNKYFNTLRNAIFKNHDSRHVALLELDPDQQKTRPDFIALEKYLGLQTVNIRNVKKVGRRLVAETGGRTVELHRIFNRAIIDELQDAGITLNFQWNDDIDVEWAGHPNWYFRISKFLLPHLQHKSVPQSIFVSDKVRIPEKLNRYVLKPLYSFAGKGVNINPTHNDVAAIPKADQENWILQEKVIYDACIPTPYGNNKAEIRVMMVWHEDEPDPLPMISLVRTGRGELMGARYNAEPWTGSAANFFV